MRRVEPEDIDNILPFFEAAAEAAREATCLRAKCGSVVVSKAGLILGRGYNAPPLDSESQRTCDVRWDLGKKPKYDKTCCVHAEWNATMDTLVYATTEEIEGSKLYFMRVDGNGEFTDAGEPYCTTCSRIVMQAGIAEFVLWNAGGADIYTLPEYNKVSYGYHETTT